MSYNRPHKVKRIPLAILILVVVIGLTVGATLLVAKNHITSSTKGQTTQTRSIKSIATATAPSQYKLTTCTSGTTQTIANASYLVGTDITPGNYKIVSQPAGTDWTNINIYNSKAKYDQEGDPSNEQGVADQSLSPQNGVTTYTKLTDGQYMVVDADPATFTCE